MTNQEIIQKLNREHTLDSKEWEQIVETYSKEDLDYAMELARKTAIAEFGKMIYFRGIIEFSNI